MLWEQVPRHKVNRIMNPFLKRYKDLGHTLDTEKTVLKQAIRINTLKAPEDYVIAQLKKRGVRLRKISFTDHGYWADADFSLSSTPQYLQGFFYIQETASQLPVKVLDPNKGDVVLDMCAAPGSKTTQLAQNMNNQGSIVALDRNPARLAALKNNLERCGVKDVVVYQKDAVHADDLKMKFDRILLDAPCSGNFTTDPGWFEKRTIEGIRAMAKTQKALLRTAVNLLKPGAILVYSTCSLEPEEDEQVIEWALDNLPLKLQDTGLNIGDSGITGKTGLCRRFWPDKTGTQGFFIAKLALK
ncbi:RsmB/NOP family class I SAM-dependent RNA methyltransferase [Candidatus Woesearchaeota archaeon]|nr:RsmB/NOP family class I SAM-dependent RNA methyltransferase [Candidatus Woesearchaeota archaeon]